MTRIARPALSLSLQFADARHRAQLPRHRIARWVRSALEAPGEITCASSATKRACA
jgi:probable rRNA maturation factor